jgi:hypothetical protein
VEKKKKNEDEEEEDEEEEDARDEEAEGKSVFNCNSVKSRIAANNGKVAAEKNKRRDKYAAQKTEEKEQKKTNN